MAEEIPQIINKNGYTILQKILKNGTEEVTIADFTLEKIGEGGNIFSTPNKNELYLLFKFTNRNGESEICLNSDVFSNIHLFLKEIGKFGGNFFETQKVLSFYKSYLDHTSTTNYKIYYLDEVFGRVDIEHKTFWVFKNGFLYNQKFYQHTRFFQFDDNKAIYFNFSPETIPSIVPTYNQEITQDDSELLMKDILNDLFLFFKNNPGSLILIIAFYASTLRYSDFFKMLPIKKHPILHISGATAVGKTEFIKLMNKLIGLGDMSPNTWQSTSNFVNQKEMSILSHIPLWRDEYRDNSKQKNINDEFLRAIYQMACTTKGSQDQTLKYYIAKSTLILTGEETPNDSAIQRRCIKIIMGSEDRINAELWDDVCYNSSKYWFGFFIYMINKKIDEDKFQTLYKRFEKEFHKETVPSDYAYLLAVFCVLLEIEDDGINQSLKAVKAVLDDNQSIEKNVDNLESYIELIVSVISKSQNVKLSNYLKMEDGFCYIWLPGMNALLNDSQIGLNISYKSLSKILRREKKAVIITSNLLDIPRKVLRIKRSDTPEYLLELEGQLNAESVSTFDTNL